MRTKVHSNRRTETDRQGHTTHYKVSMKECPACIKKCGNCRWPFTLSTAIGHVESMIFCSQQCVREGLAMDEAKPLYYKRSRHYD